MYLVIYIYIYIFSYIHNIYIYTYTSISIYIYIYHIDLPQISIYDIYPPGPWGFSSAPFGRLAGDESLLDLSDPAVMHCLGS